MIKLNPGVVLTQQVLDEIAQQIERGSITEFVIAGHEKTRDMYIRDHSNDEIQMLRRKK